VPGSMSVHLDGQPARLPAYRRAIAAGELPSGYAVDDCAALLSRGANVGSCVSSRAGARVLQIRADGAGVIAEHALPVKPLAGSQPADGEVGAMEPRGVSELRALRAGRHRWD
jgi:dipeptidase E